MNTPISRMYPAFVIFGFLVGGVMAVSAESPPPYRLFVGVDVSVPQAESDQFVEVTNFNDNEATLALENPTRVPLRDLNRYRWARHPKVSRATLTIEGFKTDRTYSLNSDPKMGWMMTQNHMAIYAQERSEMQTAEMVRTEAESQFYKGGPLESPYGAASGPTQHEAMQEAVQNMGNTLSAMDSATNPATWGSLEGSADGQEAFDTLDITFSVASSEPVGQAYVVVLADIASTRQTGTVTVFQEIGPIGPTPRKVAIRQHGLAPGFKVENAKVHVYAHGVELGSNLSDRATGLTREQVMGYLQLAHLTDHKQGNLLPVPVWELAPPALFAARDARAFDYPVAVSVGPDGQVLAIHQTVAAAYDYLKVVDVREVNTKATPGFEGGTATTQPAATNKSARIDQTGTLPPQVAAVIREFPFLPALKDGKPVKGIVEFNLANFFR